MKATTKAIINFYELPEVWQAEARDNLDDLAEETMFLEPDEDTNPVEHILWDLNECMPSKGIHDGFKFNAVIGISNNSAMLLNLSDDMESAEVIYV